MNNTEHFDQWVNDNNVDPKLAYCKGWWDYIEFIRRFGEKLNATVSVVDVYTIGTPPPEETLTLPFILLETEYDKFYLKEDFSYGGFVDQWLVSYESKRGMCIHPKVMKYLNPISEHEHMLKETDSKWIFSDYIPATNNIKFSGTVDNELDLYAFMQFIIKD